MSEAAIVRRLDKIERLLSDHPDNWETKEQIKERFGVGDTTIDGWAKNHPRIMKYRKQEKGTDESGRALRRGNLYNVKLIHELIYTSK
jgi:hypothetical protein